MGKDEGYDCVLPVTLETNVVKLHEFLYPEDAYRTVGDGKEYSDHISDISGYREEDIPSSSEDGALPADSLLNTGRLLHMRRAIYVVQRPFYRRGKMPKSVDVIIPTYHPGKNSGNL